VAYENNGKPMPGDRVEETKTGRLGTVSEVLSDPNLAVIKWDDGVVGITYRIDANFKLVARAQSTYC